MQFTPCIRDKEWIVHGIWAKGYHRSDLIDAYHHKHWRKRKEVYGKYDHAMQVGRILITCWWNGEVAIECLCHNGGCHMSKITQNITMKKDVVHDSSLSVINSMACELEYMVAHVQDIDMPMSRTGATGEFVVRSTLYKGKEPNKGCIL